MERSRMQCEGSVKVSGMAGHACDRAQGWLEAAG